MAFAIYDSVLTVLNIDFSDKNSWLIIMVIGVFLGLSLLFRVLAGLSYYGSLSAFMLFAKSIKKKEDIKSTPSRMINRCVAEYTACGDKGSPLSGIDHIVDNNLARMNFLGVNLSAIENFAKQLETAAVIMVVPSVIITGDGAFLLLFGAAYIVYKIILLFFDLGSLKERLRFGLITYINRELGCFYIGDDNAGLRIFKNEVHSSLMEQASILQNSINNLTTATSETTKASYEALRTYIGEILEKYDNIGDGLKQPVESFGKLFYDFSQGAEAIKNSADILYENISLMNEKLKYIGETLSKNTDMNTANFEKTSIVFDEISDNLKAFNVSYKGLEAEIAAIKSVQAVLDESLKKYEQSLQGIVVDFGNAVGSIAEYKGKEAADALGEGIKKYVTQFQADTQKLLEKMTGLFEQSYEQNKSEIQTLYRIEDSLRNR